MADDLKAKVEIKGYNRVRNQLRKAAAAHPEISDPIIERHAKSERLRLKGKPYPPRLPGQKYVRTGKTASSFAAVRIKLGEWAVVNTAPNREFVITRAHQARIHRGRWYTMEDELERNMPELTEALAEAIEREMEGAGDVVSD